MRTESRTGRRALDWIKAHGAPGGGVSVGSRRREMYPEVTGYLIPTLLRRGENALALSYARRLIAVQRPDGAFADPSGREAYAFDTGQVVRGFVAALPYLPEVEAPLRRACDWIVASATPEGRLAVPKGSEWSLGRRGTISEAVHLYVLPGMLAASDALGETRWRTFVARSMDWYARNAVIADFRRDNQLTHLFAYVMEALVELGAGELAAHGMKQVAELQQDVGLVPAYHDAAWTCMPGQFQCALVWRRLGDEARARRAIEAAEMFRNPSGGFYGSYGPGADYFATEEPSWVAKFELDALDARPLATASAVSARPAAAVSATAPKATRAEPRPVGGAREAPAPARDATGTTTSNLEPDAWHAAIAGGESATEIAARVRAGRAPAWFSAVLDVAERGDRVLELGSGTGELSAHLAREGRKPTLFDFSAASLELSRAVFREARLDGAFVEGDVTRRLPFPDGAFDVVWSSGLLEHFEPADLGAVVRESARVSRRTVLCLAPNAASLPYRLGKSLQERAGVWAWGREAPFATLRPAFEAAGLVDVEEITVAPEHALEFLRGTSAEPFRKTLQDWYRSLDRAELESMGQGYLLVTVGRKRQPPAPRKDRAAKAETSVPATAPAPAAASRGATLAIVPNDPLQAYVDAGYPDLAGYFNPAGAFDRVVCLSPHEKIERTLYGVEILPTPPAAFARRCAELGVDVVRAYDLPAARLVARHVPAGTPFVVSVHDVDPKRFEGELPPADLWLPVSAACGKMLRSRGADPARIAPFCNRVDLAVFRPGVDAAEQARFDARFPGKRRVLHVGRHSLQKNQDGLLAAL
ncbi:MAG TPA: methyltransferase domain-containing protein, partial [Planctomycetota bacterium]|nr:methyltransferase domain-containing protein [Planctomycetota bacterium]